MEEHIEKKSFVSTAYYANMNMNINEPVALRPCEWKVCFSMMFSI